MNWNGYHSIYFIGIGGIGMSALARYFRSLGLEVSGYDRTPTALTNALASEGISIHFEDAINSIPEKVREDSQSTLVIYTPAIPANHKEFNFLKEEGYRVIKRSEALGEITKDRFTIAVAGTHGKTTTSSILAHLLKEANRNFTAFLGGICTNFNSNYVRNEGVGEEIVVVEADEFDRSFLRLYPNVAIVTSMDADHLDIYGTEEELRKGFKDFVKNIQDQGSLIVQESLDLSAQGKPLHVLKYGLNRGQFFAGKLSIDDGFFIFDLYAENSIFGSLRLGVPGFHNIENALAALAAMKVIGEDLQSSSRALSTFKGVKRRFEYILKDQKRVFVDDYAHHPSEISSFLRSLKELFPSRKIVILFQPHLFSRTRDFAEGFAQSLAMADELYLLDIYPAREEPIEGITSQWLLDQVQMEHKQLVSKEEILESFTPEESSVFATVGAGDIDKLVEPLKRRWENE